MRKEKNSVDVATEPYAAREDVASGTACLINKKLDANLCVKNW